MNFGFLQVFLFLLILPAIYSNAALAQNKTDPLVFGQGFSVDIKIERITEAEIKKISALGIQNVRSGFLWDWVENKRGIYNWSKPLPRDSVADSYAEQPYFTYDEMIKKMHHHGLHITMILTGGNSIYTGPPVKVNWNGEEVIKPPAPRTPEAIEAFAAFAAATAKHYSSLYGPKAIDWIIWNEPDLDAFFPPAANGAIAGRIIETACKRIKEAVPEAKVMGPALGTMQGGIFRYDFVKDMFSDANPLSCLDAFTIHPYRPSPPETAPADYERMASFIAPWQPEKQVPIAVDEWGVPSSRSLLDRLTKWDYKKATEEQAALQLRMYLSNLAAGIRYTSIYEWRDSGSNLDDPEDNYGMNSFTNEEKPFIAALRFVWPRLSKHILSDILKPPSCGKKVYLLRFTGLEKKENDTLVAWTSEKHANLKLTGNFGKAFTMFGQEITPDKTSKKNLLPLSGAPILIDFPQRQSPQVACRRLFSSN